MERTQEKCAGLPCIPTVYGPTEDRLFIKSGMLTVHEDEVRLYRVLDLTLSRSLWQGLGAWDDPRGRSDKTMKIFDTVYPPQPGCDGNSCPVLVESEGSKAGVLQGTVSSPRTR